LKLTVIPLRQDPTLGQAVPSVMSWNNQLTTSTFTC
jgi:hypothetical protein